MITEATRKVYFSSVKGRHYMSKVSAIRAEAHALLEMRFPTEQIEYTNGMISYPGFHWTSLPRHEVLLRRVVRLVKRAAIAAARAEKP
ncbi:hypothetical protein ACIPEN_14430 [Herbaspirillum chlorophenolicum]|uniref:Uncharacterized protein n=1 Tax=Herbaspirillum chlorophenolicum TaxID=211589 RepID=A0ABW8F147_9BURK